MGNPRSEQGASALPSHDPCHPTVQANGMHVHDRSLLLQLVLPPGVCTRAVLVHQSFPAQVPRDVKRTCAKLPTYGASTLKSCLKLLCHPHSSEVAVPRRYSLQSTARDSVFLNRKSAGEGKGQNFYFDGSGDSLNIRSLAGRPMHARYRSISAAKFE
jgi:hypothetical protein